MEFLKDDNHRLHGGRIAGVLYMLVLLPGFGADFLSPMGLARTSFTVGWWLTFCDKRPPQLSQLFDARHMAGMVMVVCGLIAQFILRKN